MIDKIDEKISEKLKKKVNNPEANVYLLNNIYLTNSEKEEVELWFQLPGNIMFYVFIITAIYSIYNPLSWGKIIITPLILNIIAGILNWYFYNKKFIYNLYLTVFHSWILYIVGVGTAIFLLINGAIILAVISLIIPFGLLTFIEPHLLVYPLLAKKYKMHPKFAFFKKEYGHTFPFEEHS